MFFSCQELVILIIALKNLDLPVQLVKLGTFFNREHAQDVTVELATLQVGTINALSVPTSKQVLAQEYLQ